MEGEGHFEFRKECRPGKCPVRFCRRESRTGDGNRKPAKHRLCSMHRSTLTRILNPVRTTFAEKKSNAKSRGIVWSLTLEQFKEIVAQQDYMDNKGCTKQCLHLDRIDSTKGYELSNLQIITCAENVAKGNAERRRTLAGAPPLPGEEDEGDPF